MDLETAKLVAFALWAEAYEGTTGKEPPAIKIMFSMTQRALDFGGLRACLGNDLEFKFDNYLTVWEAEVKEAPASTEREQALAIEQMEEPGEEAQGRTEPVFRRGEDLLPWAAKDKPKRTKKERAHDKDRS